MSYAEVERAARSLMAGGERPTVESVRKTLGRGSPNHIATMRRKRRAGSAKRNEKAFSASSAPWATRRIRVAAHPTPMTAKIGRLSRKKLIIY